jgi:hypothetical protein
MKLRLLVTVCMIAVTLIAVQAVPGAERSIVSTPNAPKAIGPYAQAVKYGDMLFVSGMIPIDPKTNELIKAILKPSAGSSSRTSRPSSRRAVSP